VARRGKERNAYRFLLGNLREADDLEDLYLKGRVILKQHDPSRTA
jgi:hypothetical protein